MRRLPPGSLFHVCKPLYLVAAMIRGASVLVFIFPILFLHCGKKKADHRFTLVENSGISFRNNLEESKENNVFRYRNFYNGGGVATGDLNNDGLPEVLLTANQGPNKLFLNKGSFKFEDITGSAGINYNGEWSTGVVFVDINADGWLDIYICTAGNMMNKELRRNKLYINNKNLTFSEQAAAYGLDNDGYTTHASFFDYDLDGDLDCFLINNSPIPVNTLNYANMRNVPEQQAPYKDFLKGGGDHLFRNDGGKYTEVTYQSGIYGSIISFGLGVTVGDVNDDGYPDIYLSNDFFEKDYLYINQRNGTFKDEIEDRTQHISFSSMGADMQDINNDGKPDIFTTDMLPDNDYRLKTNTSFEGYEVFRLKQNQGFYNQYTQNSLQVNDGRGRFMETGFYSGIAASDWTWSALCFDADNDGLSDIFVCNGIYRDVTDQDFIDFFANEIVGQMALSGKKEEVETVINKMPSIAIPNKMFRNKGGLKFEDIGNQWGLDAATFSNGASYADLDNDGDLDLVINNVNQDAMVYRNQSREKDSSQYIQLSLRYEGANPFAVGSLVKVFSGTEQITRELIPSRGFQSSMDYKLTIGLGRKQPDSIHVVWPNRTITSISKPALNQLRQVSYKAAEVRPAIFGGIDQQAVFQQLQIPADSTREDEHVDFYVERNIPFMLSRQGPKAAVADVNGDGLDDVYVGGAMGKPRQLLLQKADGWVPREVPDFKRINFNDVTAAVFFDADQDGDADLFTGGGGNAEPAESDIYQNHLFLNDGQGNFTIKAGTFPFSGANCGVAVPMDYDGDGKTDLFIGGRSKPQQYGVPPPGFIMRNKGNALFEDVTASVFPELQHLGMVTGADWKDIDGDKRPDLVITGEWMAPRVYTYNGQKFSVRKTGLEELSGWWQSLAVADLDGDGDQDLVLGNLGENFYLRPDKDHPVHLWIKDFDGNGIPEKVFSHMVGNKDVPVFLKKEVTEQVPTLKKMNLKHDDYAKRSVQDLFGESLKGAQTLEVNYGASCLAINDGKGVFTVKPLPQQTTLSSINAIHVTDVNDDGKPDILAAGNFFDLLPQFCRIDASYAHTLINNGDGSFRALTPYASGIRISGQVRDIQQLQVKGRPAYLFMVNNAIPMMYSKMQQGAPHAKP